MQNLKHKNTAAGLLTSHFKLCERNSVFSRRPKIVRFKNLSPSVPRAASVSLDSLSCVQPISVNLLPVERRLNAVTKTRFSDASYYYWRSATEAYAAAEDPKSRYFADC